MQGWYLSLKIRTWGKNGSVLAVETPCLAVGFWLALTPRLGFSEGGLKAASRRSPSPVSLPSLHQPHSFHRADFQINIFGSLKVVLETFLVL